MKIIKNRVNLRKLASNGTLYWITGFSGSGKTTIGKALYNYLKKLKTTVVFLDGDELREVFGNDLGYTIKDRKNCAMRYSRLSKLLTNQGISVVCATISMFNECRKWNRKEILLYKEIYIKTPMNILKQKDIKGLYNNKIKMRNIMGIDLKPETPENPDIIINNDRSEKIKTLIDKLIKDLNL